MNHFQIAKKIINEYQFGVKGLIMDLKVDPEYPAALVLTIYEQNFSEFSDNQRLILTENLLDVQRLLTAAGVDCRLAKGSTL